MPLVTFNDDFENLIEEFLAILSGVSRSVLKDQRWSALVESQALERDTMDFVDGRMFRAVIQALCDNTIEGTIPLAAQNDWETLSLLVKKLANEDLSLEENDNVKSSEIAAVNEESESLSEGLAILPFSNPVFDKHLECIHLNTDASVQARMERMKIYREATYWHSRRKPVNTRVIPVQKVSKWK